MQQKESEKSHYRNLFEKQNEDEKNLTLQQFYDKKVIFFIFFYFFIKKIKICLKVKGSSDGANFEGPNF